MIHFKLVQYLADQAYIRPGARIMDVGTQNILYAEEGAAIDLVRKLRSQPLTPDDIDSLKRVCYFSTPRPGERTAFLHEILALTDVNYQSIDIVDGLKTTIFDLNFDTAPQEWRGAFDLVINCGTLEHVIHQYNALTFMHEVLSRGGIWFDQPPSVGFLNHGYHNYHPLFYLDMAAANSYELLEAWYSHAGTYPVVDVRFPVVAIDRLDQDSEREKAARIPFSAGETQPVERGPSYNFNVVMRKTVDAPLKLPLEVRTTHGPLGKDVSMQYGTSVFDSNAKK